MSSSRLNVAVLYGGKNTEHEISLISAKNIVNQIDQNKYQVHLIAINHLGQWFWQPNFKFNQNLPCQFTPDRLIKINMDMSTNPFMSGVGELPSIDIVFPVLHGINGEDGTIQGLLRCLNLPFVGCDVLSSALCMDKVAMKQMMQSANIATAPWRVVLSNEIENASNEKVLHLEASRLEDLNPQFADLMKDYKKGILVFKIQQTEVWNKIKIDSVKLQDFFNANRDKYIWPDSVDFTEIFSRSDSLLKHYLKLYKQGESFDTLASKYTERGGFKKKGGNWGMRRADFNDLTKKASTLKNPGEISDLYQNYGGYSLIRLNKRIPAHKKTFKEAKNEVAAAYQEIQAHNLENEYLRKLEKKYEPVILQENLSEAFK